METILLNYLKQLILYMSEEEKFLINMFGIKSDLEYASITFHGCVKALEKYKEYLKESIIKDSEKEKYKTKPINQ